MFNDFTFKMQKFQTYSLSPYHSNDKYSNKSSPIVIDDKQNFPRFTSNDSGISFGDSDNESILVDECEFDIDQSCLSPLTEQCSVTITNDGKKYLQNRNQKMFLNYFIFSSYGISNTR